MKQTTSNPVTVNGTGAGSQNSVLVKLIGYIYKLDFPYGDSERNYVVINQRPGESFKKAKRRTRISLLKDLRLKDLWLADHGLEYVDGLKIGDKVYVAVAVESI